MNIAFFESLDERDEQSMLDKAESVPFYEVVGGLQVHVILQAGRVERYRGLSNGAKDSGLYVFRLVSRGFNLMLFIQVISLPILPPHPTFFYSTWCTILVYKPNYFA